jgi:hypothetical protein
VKSCEIIYGKKWSSTQFDIHKSNL